MEYATIGGFIGVPLAILIFLKSDPSLVYLSACAGVTLQVTATEKLTSLLRGANINFLNTDTVSLLLLGIPILVAILLLRGTIVRSKMLFHLPAAICLGVLLAIAAVPHLSSSLVKQITTGQGWELLDKYGAIVIAVGAAFSIFIASVNTPKTDFGKKHK